MLKLILKG